MSTMWEVDPETRTKLAEIQKRPGNNVCCDCSAPAPQWASPKFSTFICLTCAGTHRGLGVHISFVRSITMDAFKTAEIKRMEMGGNKAWKEFFEKHETTVMNGVGWDECTVAERYGGEVGEEWKERLSAKVEGREWVKGEGKTEVKRSTTSLGREESPAAGSGRGGGASGGASKEKNERFFAKLGEENASRSAELPPSQGGKYAGFGSAPPLREGAGRAADGGVLPGLDDLQKDPVAAVSKGLGWFAAAVGKGAKQVNDGFIQPTAQKIAEADLAAQARTTASTLGQTIQTGTKGAAETFNRFVEDTGSNATNTTRGGRTAKAPLDESKKDFWDSFGAAEESAGGLAAAESKPSSIGTAAMRKGGPSSGAAGGSKGGKEGGDGWEDDKWEKF